MTTSVLRTNKAKLRELRAKAHSLKPIVRLGQNGLSDSVISELDLALAHHELVKVKLIAEDRIKRRQTQADLCHAVGADCVQLIGNTVTLYRQKTDDEKKLSKTGHASKSRQRSKSSRRKSVDRKAPQAWRNSR